MKKVGLITVFLLVTIVVFGKKRKTQSTLYQFIENQGQFHPNALFRTDLPGGVLFMERNTLTYHFYDAALRYQMHEGKFAGDIDTLKMRYHAYRAVFVGANTHPKVETDEKFINYYNFFIGNDHSKWAGNVPAYGKLNYREMYPGIDFIMYSDREKGLKYDLMVQPGSSPEQIKIKYEGVSRIYLKNGKLYIITSLTENWEEKPEAYQQIGNKRVKVKCRYVLNGNTLSYEFPNGYNKNYPLIIDPTLVFSSYSGATSNNFGYTATYDKFGYLYSGSTAFGLGYPTTMGAYQTFFAGGNGGSFSNGVDIVLSKWDTTGTFLVYSTYLGGSSDELPHSLVVTEFNELYMMGTTSSLNYPVTSGAFDTTFNINPNGPIPVNLTNGLGILYQNGSDIVITKFNSTGNSLDASTFLGGTHTDGINDGANKFNYADEIRGEIDLDPAGKVYVATCTRSNDNPVGSTGFQTTKPSPNTNHIDGIIYKLNHNLSALEWTNYIGGSGADAAYSIAIARDSSIYITGGTQSSNYPATLGSFDASYNGSNDGFVMHITADGSNILQSSFYGTVAYDQSYFVELDDDGNVYLFGQTAGGSGLLISNATYNEPLGGQFIVKFNSTLNGTVWATRFGSGDGTPDISPTAFLVDLCNAVYLSGWGSPIQGGSLSTTGLDTAGGALQGTTDGQDFYVMVMADDASSLNYATYFGGSAAEHVDGGTSRFDRKGKIYQAVCAGCGGSNDFPTTSGAVSNINGTSQACNLAVFKMDFLLPAVVADFTMPSTGCAPFSTPFDNLSLAQSATVFHWDFGDGTTSNQFEPNHIYSSPGVYTVTLIVSDTATCNLADTLTRTITILSNTNTILPDAPICPGSSGVQIGIPQNNDPNLTYSWHPALFLSDTAITNPIANPPTDMSYFLVISNGICNDTIFQNVVYDTMQFSLTGDTVVCGIDAPFQISANPSISGGSYHWSNFSDFSDSINQNPNDSVVFVQAPDSINWYYLHLTSPLGCTYVDSFKIRLLNPNPVTASFTDPGPGCAPYTINFNNTSNGTPQTYYHWYFGNGDSSTAANPSITYTAKGNYAVTLIIFDTNICPETDTFTIYIETREDSSYTINQIVCANQDTEIGIPADTLPGTTYSWFPSTGLSNPTIHNPIINTSADITYLLVVQHVCVDSVTVNVTAEPVFAFSPNQVVLCSDNPIVTLTINSWGSGQNFVWSSQSDFSDTLNAQLWDSTVVLNQTLPIATYYFMVESPNGCLANDTTDVIISDLTVDVTPDQYICQGDTTTITATNNYPNNPMDYFWSPASEIIGPADVPSITVAPLVNTTYYLSAINDSGCVFKDTVLIEVSPLNAQMVEITVDLDSLLEGTSTMAHAKPAPGFVYSWEPARYCADPTASSTLVTPEKTTTFYCTVSDPRNSNCAYKKGVEIRTYEINCGEPEIFIPNAFSPNYDGEHDVYLVQGQVIESLELKIYNRWGQLVFETDNKDKGWDGHFKDELVDPAVFVYHLEVVCVDGQHFTKKGNITVIR